MKIRAVFFDAGETLIFRNPSMVTITARHLASAGVKIPRAKLAKAINEAALEMKPAVERGRMADSRKWEIYIANVFRKIGVKNSALEHKLRMRLRDGTSFKAFRDAHEVVDFLNSRGIKTGIISNASATLDGILKRVKLHGKFRHIVISEKAGVEKPNKQIFLKALRLAKSRAQETVYIGDNYVADIYGAKRAGLVPVWIQRKSKNAEFSYTDEGRTGVRKVSSLKGLIKLMQKEEWL